MDMPHRGTPIAVDLDFIPPLIFNPAQIMKNNAMIMLPTYPIDHPVVSGTSQGQHHEPLFFLKQLINAPEVFRIETRRQAYFAVYKHRHS
ncbi:hypothetical protein ACFL2O_06950 [Thermodesulfobacteriota bacterium]